jgi:four helix bundle protein
MRDHRKLFAFQKADTLVLATYTWSRRLPVEERYTLRSQILRAAVSIPANIVEGSARASHGEYVNHLSVALGSAAELAYLLRLAGRIYPSTTKEGNQLLEQADEVIKLLVTLIARLKSLKPKA